MTNSTPDARWRRQIIVVLAIMLATASSIVLCPAPDVSAGTYNPLKAVQYANQWWNKRNPKFQSYGFNDCANYVSQCLIAGGLSLRASPSADKSGSLAQCTSLDAYLTNTLKATVWKTSSSARPPTALQPGDVAIFGNWLGLRHAVFVSAKQTNGQPLFNAHTYDRLRTTIDWLFSAWTYVKYYHIVKSPITVAVAAKPAAPAKTAVVAQPAVTTRSSIAEPKPEPVETAALVKTVPASSVTSTSALLHGIVRPDGQTTLWFFEYGVSEDYDEATDKQGPLLGNMTYDVDLEVAGLKESTLYHARLVRVAPDGSLTTGSDITFKTTEAPHSVTRQD
ncbi:MAG TPA: amidase domain-containing protein [Clostridia bacterium]|nr:amidase domain-containing protein [Clostridia bacterium]